MNMRNNTMYKLFIFIISVSINQTVWSDNWIDQVSYSKQNKFSQDEISDGYIHLLYDNQINIDTQEDYLRSVIKVIGNAGLSDVSTISIDYDQSYQTLQYHFIRLIRNGETIHVLDKQQPETIRRETQLENGILDGRLTSFLEIKDVRVGDIIDYAYTIKGYNPIKEGLIRWTFNLNYSIPIEKINLKIQTKQPDRYQYTLLNNAPQPTITKHDQITAFSWTVNKPVIMSYEHDAPTWYNPYAQVIYSSKIDWARISRHISTLYRLNEPLSNEIRSFVNDVKTKFDTKEDQTKAVLRYVQNEIRYLGNENGIYAYKPRHPNVTFRDKTGDCKEKSWLLAQMLGQVYYQAYPALVNTYNGEIINTLPPGYESFDHCITCVINNNDTLFIDPTITNQEGSLVTTQIPDYGYALIINNESDQLHKINTNRFYSVSVKEEITIDDYSGKADLKVSSTYKGSSADVCRNQFKNSSLKEIQDNYLRFYANSYPRIDTIKLLSYDDNTKLNEFVVVEFYQIDNIWERKDSVSQKQTANFGAYSLSYEINRTNYPDRKSPVALSFPYRYHQEIKINLPEEWNLSNMTNTVKSSGFVYENTVVKQGKTVFLSYDYQTTGKLIAQEDYQTFIEKNEEVLNDLSYSIFNYGTSNSAADKSVNISFIIIALLVFVIGIYLVVKIYKVNHYPKTTVNDGRNIGGWLILIAIGVTLTPLALLYTIKDMNYFEADAWSHILNPQSSEYSVQLGVFIIVEMILNLLFLIFSVLNIILFYQRRTTFPLVFTIYLVCNFLFIALDYTVGIHYDLLEFDNEVVKDLSKRLIFMGILIPYLFVSTRVKETFIMQLKS